jgi:hypothetical protein
MYKNRGATTITKMQHTNKTVTENKDNNNAPSRHDVKQPEHT